LELVPLREPVVVDFLFETILEFDAPEHGVT
jgi:hypothetical protein